MVATSLILSKTLVLRINLITSQIIERCDSYLFLDFISKFFSCVVLRDGKAYTGLSSTTSVMFETVTVDC